MESLNFSPETTQNQSKKASSVVVFCVLCTFTTICVLLSFFAVSLSFSKTPENTLQLFGYKIYCAENNIDEINVKAGSLIVVKDTDTDEYYTHESLSQNIVFSIENLGYYIKHNLLWMILCFTAPLAAFFLIILISELKKVFAKNKAVNIASKPQEDIDNIPQIEQDDTGITV